MVYYDRNANKMRSALVRKKEDAMSVVVTQVAVYHSDLPTKFGIPRQSGLAGTEGYITFLPPYRDPSAIRGIEGFSHLWLLWEFSLNRPSSPSLTVRPPRLGGNEKVGVFASRSPFRPSPIGLSSVRMMGITTDAEKGPVLYVEGADLADGTPIYDIKPYLAFTDSHPDAVGGFADVVAGKKLSVVWPPHLRGILPPEKEELLTQLLTQDPRPAYQDDPERVYGLPYAGYDVRFSVRGKTLIVKALSDGTDLSPHKEDSAPKDHS